MLNKKNISLILGSLRYVTPWKNLIQRHQELPFLPFYHAIGDSKELPHIKHLYRPSSSEKFEEDLDAILSIFKAISLEELILFARKEITFDQPVFHLSFDDGLRQVYEIAMPILKRKGIPATIFVNSDFVDNRSLFFRYKVSLIAEEFLKRNESLPPEIFDIKFNDDSLIQTLANKLNLDFQSFLDEYQPYMSLNQLKDWVREGFSLGGHSLNHPYYHLIDIEEQKRQTIGSIHFLKQTLDIDYKSFAFPFSDAGVSSHFYNELYQNQELDISFGTSGAKYDELDFHFQRTGMELGNRSADSIIAGEYLYCSLAGLVGKHIRKR